MIKVLLKKQWLAMTSFLMQGKNGKRRSNKALLGFAILLLYGFGAMGAMFWLLADMLCEPLVSAGLSWVYFSLMGVMATALGVIVILRLIQRRF